jgi:serine acetyltransferase
VLAAYHGDPAAGSVDEVLLCYPGVLAMIHHRLAHELYKLDLPPAGAHRGRTGARRNRHRHSSGRADRLRDFLSITARAW